MSGLRPLRLRNWLVRALVPSGVVGTYALHRDGSIVYVGRSDTDLQRRLLQHAAINRGDYFTYDVHLSAQHAFEVECSQFHIMKGATSNVIHPAAPANSGSACPFCLENANLTLSQRLVAHAL